MNNPIVITYVDENMSDYAEYLREACSRIDTPLHIYTPDTVESEKPSGYQGDRDFGRLQHKPSIIRQALKEHQRPIIWIDADAFPIAPLDIDWEFDIAFTLRGQNQGSRGALRYWNGLTNSGVIFVHNTIPAHQLLDEIQREIPRTKTNSDQEGINRVLIKRGWDERLGHYNLGGVEVRILNCDIYNNIKPFDNPNTKILHFKCPFRKHYLKYFNQHIGTIDYVKSN